MKQYERFIYHAATYTVSVSIIFFVFAKLLGFSDTSMSFGRYMLIFAFSLILASAENILTYDKIHVALRFIIHYSILCVAFYLIFINVKNAEGNPEFKISGVFASVFIFTFLYVIFAIILAIYGNILRSKDNKDNGSPKSKKNKRSEAYTPKFKE